MWTRHGMLPEDADPAARARELIAAAYKDGRLAAVATATMCWIDFLHGRFAVIRGATAPEFRRSHAQLSLSVPSREALWQWAREHPEEAFAANVIAIDKLTPEAVAAIATVLAEGRALALGAEKHAPDSDVLAKRLDKLFEQELEWLAIRNLLAAALPRTGGRKPAGKRGKKGARVLLLLDV